MPEHKKNNYYWLPLLLSMLALQGCPGIEVTQPVVEPVLEHVVAPVLEPIGEAVEKHEAKERIEMREYEAARSQKAALCDVNISGVQ